MWVGGREGGLPLRKSYQPGVYVPLKALFLVRISNKHNPIMYPYKLHSIELKSVETAKYL